MSKAVLSRRDFLKLSGYGLMGILCPKLPIQFLQQDDFDNLQGRVLDRTLWEYDFRWTTPTVPLDKELIYGYVGTRVEIKV